MGPSFPARTPGLDMDGGSGIMGNFSLHSVDGGIILCQARLMQLPRGDASRGFELRVSQSIFEPAVSDEGGKKVMS